MSKIDRYIASQIYDDGIMGKWWYKLLPLFLLERAIKVKWEVVTDKE